MKTHCIFRLFLFVPSFSFLYFIHFYPPRSRIIAFNSFALMVNFHTDLHRICVAKWWSILFFLLLYSPSREQLHELLLKLRQNICFFFRKDFLRTVSVYFYQFRCTMYKLNWLLILILVVNVKKKTPNCHIIIEFEFSN